MKDLNYLQIGGNMKAGTSLLSALFEGHPNVACYAGGQTNFTGWFYPLLSDPGVPLERKVELIRERLDHVGRATPEQKERMFASLQAKSATLSDDFLSLHYCLLETSSEVVYGDDWPQASVWLDKSPHSHVFADELFEVFPSARFIHVVREPKDNFSSAAVRLLNKGVARIYIEALLWRHAKWTSGSMQYAIRNQQKYGASRYFVLRYEDLVSDLESSMERLAAFAGIEMHECLLRPTRVGQLYKGNNKEGKKFDGVSASSIGGWKTRIPGYCAKVMENQPVEALRHFGYEQVFPSHQRMLAATTHRMITAFMPDPLLRSHSDTYTKPRYHPRLFEEPGPGDYPAAAGRSGLARA